MHPTLRRSCAACAKSKSSCDLRIPRCSRCIKRKAHCIYANEPSTALAAPVQEDIRSGWPLGGSNILSDYRLCSFDPFDSYPQTRLPQERVQRLIHSFLHKIAFQYYPLDMSTTSNPFLVSWWPLALGDPALFHVSLQTACLDEELLTQRGFQTSEVLMADSVALLRRKIGNVSRAIEDGTMNSVITLAAIEFGKGNIKTSQTHVDGVKKLVSLRGGINSVRQTSPLTARMVSWVSMLIMGYPQFETQDDTGVGKGVSPIPEWQLVSDSFPEEIPELDNIYIERAVRNVLIRLRNVFRRAGKIPLPSTHLHDLACFVTHRLLLPGFGAARPQLSPITECLRDAIVLYMFILQGPTYYSHTVILTNIVSRFKKDLEKIEPKRTYNSLDAWLYAIGMVASSDTIHYQWFTEKASTVATALRIKCSDDALNHIKRILWLETPSRENIFRYHWDTIA